MTTDKEKQIIESLADKEYRDALAVEHVNSTLAIQIRKMREHKPWRQSDLAENLGKHQETVSQWENPDYGRYSLTTLKEIASAFDVALQVKFMSFNELVKDMVNLTPARLCPPSYNEDIANRLLTTNSVTTVMDQIFTDINNSLTKRSGNPVIPSTVGPYDPNRIEELKYAVTARV
jgi:transcriptional regulator with XRE-family HTH domain